MDRSSSFALTKTTIDAVKPQAKRYEVWDTELAGFGLRIETSGTKTFIVRYRAEGGGRNAPRRFFTVGRFGTLTVVQARKAAAKILGAVANGQDPSDDRQAKRREMRVAGLIDLYEEEGCIVQRGKRQGIPMKPKTKAYTIARLRHHVVPLLGHKRVSEVNAGDVERFVRDVTAGKTASDTKMGPRKRIIVRGGEGAARKVVRDLSAVFSFAARNNLAEKNPCLMAAVRKTDNQNERFLRLEEVARLGAAFDSVEADGANPKAIQIGRLWALTGCRREEIAGLRWGEVDFDRGLLVFADSKTGKSVRPLSLAAIAILKGIEPTTGSDFVFPAERGDRHFQGTKSIWTKVITKAVLPGVTPHTLRHTMGSTAISTGEAMAFTGAILGHSNPRSTAIYAHVQHDPSKRAADRVAKRISAALAGNVQQLGRTRSTQQKAADPAIPSTIRRV